MSQSQQERVDRLMSKLQHPLDDVRRRSLQNLASKVSAGLVAPERVVSDVIATRSLVQPRATAPTVMEATNLLVAASMELAAHAAPPRLARFPFKGNV